MYSRATWIAALTGLAALAACNLQKRSATGVDNSVTQVVVYPDTLTLDPQQSFQFRVFGRTQAGDSVSVAVRWETSAGSVSPFGVYTADTSVPDAVVTATLANSSVSGSSNVRKRRVTQVVISPKNLTLQVGGLQQFLAYGRRNTGDSVNIPVTYLATGGSISGGGAYTAGQTPGAYRAAAAAASAAASSSSSPSSAAAASAAAPAAGARNGR